MDPFPPFGVIMSRLPFLRSPFNYDMSAASAASGLKCLDPSRTRQEYKADADINVIAERFGLLGTLPASGLQAPTYEDFASITDYHTALNTIRAAAGAFMELPALVRERFGNDPQRFVEFCSNPEHAQERIKMGLSAPLVVPEGEPTLTSPQHVVAPSTVPASAA